MMTLYRSTALNPFPNKPWFLRVYSKNLLKTLWEKEKLLVTSNFSFSHSVFYPLRELSVISSNLKLSSANSFNLEESKMLSFGKGLNICMMHSQIFDIFFQHFALMAHIKLVTPHYRNLRKREPWNHC